VSVKKLQEIREKFENKNILAKTNLLLYSPYYAKVCNEFTVPISTS